ncbi:MAG: ATP synthase F1 subunit delta [Bdellovibrionales bacterium]|nr:ATP synthase F1 subunit delta [Bdellovibrionales bacterium]
MQVSEIAKRYAEALYSLATSNGSTEASFGDIAGLEAVLKNDEAVLKFLSAPVFSQAEKQEFVNKTFASVLKSDKVQDFLRILVEKNRIELLPEIIAAFNQADDKKNQRLRGVVKAANTLSEAECGELEKAVSEKLGKSIQLDFQQDPTLIGGVRIEVGSFLFDGSLKSNLRMLNESIMRSVQ